MAEAFGLYTHIRNNRIRSTLLLAGLFVLAYLASFGVFLIVLGASGGSIDLREAVSMFTGCLLYTSPSPRDRG